MTRSILTLPAATDTLVARNTTDTLTNKTLTSPTLTTPSLGVASATSINKVAITAPATSATLTIPDGVTLTGPASSGTAKTLGNTETVTGVKTFGSSGAVGRLKVAGTTSGSTILDATAAASGTLTLPAATDTLVGKATTDTLTNKTLTSPAISGPTVTGTADFQQAVVHSGDITPTQIVATTNDYAPTGFSTASVVRISTDASRDITGLAGGADGRTIYVLNTGSFSAVLKDEGAGSTAANRFGFGADLTLGSKQGATLIYDSTASRWRQVGGPSASGGGAGTVTQVVCGTGLTGGTITTSGTCAVDYATKSDQQTGTSAVKEINPLHQQDHPSAIKFSISCTLSGTTATLRDQYNLNGGSGGSCGRTGVGLFTVTFNAAFATAFYTCVANSSLDRDRTAQVTSKSTGTLNVQTSSITTGTLGDFNFDVICTGTQ